MQGLPRVHGVGFHPFSSLCAGLCAWRDKVARAEDESTGYVLSRSLLQKLAMQLPTTATKVKSLCNSRYSPQSNVAWLRSVFLVCKP